MKNDVIRNIFTYLLSRPPCRSGLRLRSEPDLARLLNVPRQTVRRSLDVLVEEGYLTRKHGSGTYVRKVFPAEDALAENMVRKHYAEIIPEQVFVEDQPLSRHSPEQRKHRLRIGISGDSALLTKTNQLIFSGARSRLETLGHKPIAYSQLIYDTSTIKNAEELAEELQKTQCDGYLIECWWAELFKEAFRLAFGGNCNIPVTYFWPGSIPLEHEPLIQMDTDEAVARAVRILAAKCYSRIALIAMDRFPHAASQEVEIYQRTMAMGGLTYRGSIGVSDLPGSELKKDLAAMWENNRPDAVYVSDDHYLAVLHDWMKENRLIPGKDLAVITLWNRNGGFPGHLNWSRLEFDPRQVGILAIDNMVKSINSTEEGICSFSHQASWIPGTTH